MRTFIQAKKMLKKVEKVVGHNMISVSFFSDESGTFIDNSGFEEEFLFSFSKFEEIEVEFVEWQEKNAEYLEEQRNLRKMGRRIANGGCG